MKTIPQDTLHMTALRQTYSRGIGRVNSTMHRLNNSTVLFIREIVNPHEVYTFGQSARIVRAMLGPEGDDTKVHDLVNPGKTVPYGMVILDREILAEIVLQCAEAGHAPVILIL